MKSNKTLQIFTDEYLENCKKMTINQRAQFLEDFRLLQKNLIKPGSKLISLKVQNDLLDIFKRKSELEGVKYQTQIKKLMLEWIES